MLRRSAFFLALVSLAALPGCALDRLQLGGTGGGGFDGGPSALDDAAPLPFDAGCELGAEITPLARVEGSALASPAATRDGVQIDADQLVLELQPHRYGALAMRGAPSDGSPIDLEALAGTSSERGVVFVAPSDLDFGNRRPRGLDVTQDDFEVIATGEIFLESGEHSIAVHFDDRGAMRVGSAAVPLATVAGTVADEVEATFGVAADGWYPLVIGVADNGGDSFVRLTWTGPEGREISLSDPSRVRTLVRPGLEGREQQGWDSDNFSEEPAGSRIDPDESSVAWADYPRHVGITHQDSFVVRWLSRVALGADDARVQVETGDGHRIFVDGVFFGGDLGSAPVAATHPTGLRDGAYDLVLDVHERMSDAYARLGRDSAASPWPAAAFSPALRFGGQAHAAGEQADVTVAASEEATVTLTMIAPDEVPTAVEVSSVVSAADPMLVDVRIEHDSEIWTELLGASARPGAEPNQWMYRRVLRAADGADDSAGDWRITIVNRGTSDVFRAAGGVLAHHGGTPDPYPAEGTFVSAPIDLGAPAVVTRAVADAVAWYGTSFVIEARAAESDAALPRAPWIAVDRAGELAEPIAGRWAQVRATLRGPRTDTPRLRSIELLGRACSAP